MSKPTALIDAHHIGLNATGNETWARNVVRHLNREDAPFVYRFAGCEEGLNDWDELGVSRDAISLISSKSSLRLLRDMPRLIQRLKPSAQLYQYTLPINARNGTVLAVHDLSFLQPGAKEWLPTHTRLRYKTSIGKSAKRASAIVVLTDYVKQEIVHYYGVDPDKIFIGSAAVDDDFLELAGKVPQQERKSVVLFVGNPLPRKNLDVVAQAVKRMPEDFKLRIVGGTNDRGAPAVERARTLLGDRLELAGRVSLERLIQEYKRAAVLAYPSLSEGFGLPLLEAMAADAPVVASDATALPEVGADAALFANASDPHDWAGKLQSASESSTTEVLRKKGHQRVSDFSWAATAQTVEQAMQSAAQ